MTSPLESEAIKAAKYILFKNHCHPEDGELFYKKMIDGISNLILSFAQKAREEALREAANIAKSEEEPKSEDFPSEYLEAFLKSPVHSMIASVVATKKNIEKRILALLKEKGR